MFIKEIIVGPVAHLHERAYACCEAGQIEEAIACLQEALQLCRTQVGEQHQDFAFTLCNLSSMMCLQQQHKQALPYAKRALDIALPILGKQHAMVGHMYTCLGHVYSAQNCFDEAVASFEEALAIQEETLGPYHHHVSTTCNGLAIAYYHMNDHPRAVHMLQRALEVLKYSSDPNGELITSYHILGKVHVGAGNMDKGRYYLDKAHRLLQRTRGKDHEYTKSVEQELKMVAFTANRTSR